MLDEAKRRWCARDIAMRRWWEIRSTVNFHDFYEKTVYEVLATDEPERHWASILKANNEAHDAISPGPDATPGLPAESTVGSLEDKQK